MDVFDREKRSDIMRCVKSSGNRSTEERMIAFFKEHGIKGWQRNYKIYGKPDFVFRNQNHQLNWWYAQALKGHNTGYLLRGTEKSVNRRFFSGCY